MRKVLIIIGFIFSHGAVHAQNAVEQTRKFNIGLGIGLDYGGIGLRGTLRPTPGLGLFSSIGYNLNSIGSNTGIQLHVPGGKNSFYFTGMYGYNAVLIVEAPLNTKGTYYGFSAGIGYEIHFGISGKTFLNIELLAPFRSSNFDTDKAILQQQGYSITGANPVLYSIGFHF